MNNAAEPTLFPDPRQIPPADALYVLAVVGAALLIVALLALWRWYRRRRARQLLSASIRNCALESLQDVLIPDGQGGVLHIDYLLLTARGVVVIDLRDVAGIIFGGDQMTAWTVLHRASRYTFNNPQSGLYDRVAAVRALAGELPVEGLILFTRRARFPKGLPKYTGMLESLPQQYPAVDRASAQPLLEHWKPGWEKLQAVCKPSQLADPKPAV